MQCGLGSDEVNALLLCPFCSVCRPARLCTCARACVYAVCVCDWQPVHAPACIPSLVTGPAVLHCSCPLLTRASRRVHTRQVYIRHALEAFDLTEWIAFITQTHHQPPQVSPESDNQGLPLPPIPQPPAAVTDGRRYPRPAMRGTSLPSLGWEQ